MKEGREALEVIDPQKLEIKPLDPCVTIAVIEIALR